MTDEERDMLEECLEADSGLTGWEIDFIEDMSNRDSDYELTEKQHDKLRDIWEKVTR
jgi:hypothetical protein